MTAPSRPMALPINPVAVPEKEPEPQAVPISTGPIWTRSQRLAFRFVFVYLILYTSRSQSTRSIPFWATSE